MKSLNKTLVAENRQLKERVRALEVENKKHKAEIIHFVRRANVAERRVTQLRGVLLASQGDTVRWIKAYRRIVALAYENKHHICGGKRRPYPASLCGLCNNGPINNPEGGEIVAGACFIRQPEVEVMS